MPLTTTPHLNFCGNASEALDFYHSVFGGERTALTYAQAASTYGEAGIMEDASIADQIMWGQVETANGFRVMAYDIPPSMAYNQGENSFFMQIFGESEDEIRPLWEGLAEGGTIIHPIGPAPWGAPLYGMLKDRFGVAWALDVPTPKASPS